MWVVYDHVLVYKNVDFKNKTFKDVSDLTRCLGRSLCD